MFGGMTRGDRARFVLLYSMYASCESIWYAAHGTTTFAYFLGRRYHSWRKSNVCLSSRERRVTSIYTHEKHLLLSYTGMCVMGVGHVIRLDPSPWVAVCHVRIYGIVLCASYIELRDLSGSVSFFGFSLLYCTYSVQKPSLGR